MWCSSACQLFKLWSAISFKKKCWCLGWRSLWISVCCCVLTLKERMHIKCLRHWGEKFSQWFRSITFVGKYFYMQTQYLSIFIFSIHDFLLSPILALHFPLHSCSPKLTHHSNKTPSYFNSCVLLKKQTFTSGNSSVVLNAVHTASSEHLHLSKAIFCSNAGAVS